MCCGGGAVAPLVDYLLVGATACAAWRAAQEEEARAERAARLEGDARTAQLLDELAQVRTQWSMLLLGRCSDQRSRS
jgi:hypothetical protein